MNWMIKLLLLVLALAVVAVLGLLAAGLRGEAGQVDVTVEIGRPAAIVFPWLHEGDKVKQWVSWLKEVRPLTPVKNGVGTREIWVMQDANNGNTPMEIVSEGTLYDPPRRMAAKLTARDAFTGGVTYELTESGGRTTLRYRGSFEYQHWFARLLEPLITPEARKKLVGDLATLKRLVEAAAP